MKKKLIKITILITIIILLTTPITTSISIKNQNKEIKEKITTKNTTTKIQEIINKINETLIKKYLEQLTYEIGCRYTGTYGCKKAAKYIHNEFENMQLQTRYQNWSDWGNRWHPGHFKSQNIEGTHKGTDTNHDEVIIFNAHYDTVKETVGANDDGSGTIGVLAAAYVLSQYNFKRTMKFVTVSGEEIGLLGSTAYAKELYEKQTPVLVEFNADMIGRATTYETGKKIRLSITEDADWIAETMQKFTVDYNLNFNITPGWSINRDARHGGSDYFGFIQHGYESVCVWQGESDPNMHTPRDNISNVNISYLVNTTRHIAATMAIIADAEIETPQVYIANPRFDKVFIKDKELKTYRYRIPLVIDKTNIYAETIPGIHSIDHVEFYYDNKKIFNDTEKPYTYTLNKRSIGFHTIKVVVYDTQGNTATDEMKMLFLNLFKNNR